MSRARHEHQIKLNDYSLSGGNTFDAAIASRKSSQMQRRETPNDQ